MTDGIARAATAGYARGPLRGAVVAALGWHATNDLAGLVSGRSVYSDFLLVALIWLVFAVIAILAAVQAWNSAHGDPAFVVICLLLLEFGTVAQIAVTPHSHTFTPANWAWTNVSWFAMLLLWRFPLRWLLAFMVVNVAVTAVALALTRPMDPTDWSRLTMVVYGAGAIELGVAWGARVLERVAQNAHERATAQAAVERRRVASGQVHRDRQVRYREVGERVRQLLTGLATGGLDPGAVGCRTSCAVEASRLRRLIAEHDEVPSPLTHELRACADIAERRGVAVTLEIIGDLPDVPVTARRALTDRPLEALAAASSYARVTAVWSDDDSELQISVVSDIDSRHPLSAGPDDGTDDPERRTLWVKTQWRPE